MSYRLAKSLIRLRDQINAAYPNRDKSSDGWIGDTSHQGRKSDHNPNAAGVVTAIDVDENLTSPTGDAFNLVHALQASRDPRIKYIIYERQITVPGDVTRWKPYHGPSPHDHHFHISVSADPRLYDDSRDWNLSAVVQPPTLPVPSDEASSKGSLTQEQPPILRKGSTGPEVTKLQQKLRERGYTLEISGTFDDRTAVVLKRFQASSGIDVDGECGKQVRRALGI